MTTKQYHILVTRYEAGERWEVMFGSWLRSEVEAEMWDYRDHTVLASDLKIISCEGRQSAIDAIVAAMNEAAQAEG